MFFDMPRNIAVQQKGSSAVLFRTFGLYYNAEMFRVKYMNRIPISGPNLKVASKTVPSENSSHNIHTPFYVKIGQRSEKITRVNTVYEYKPVHMNK
jgi:hypothetical protein